MCGIFGYISVGLQNEKRLSYRLEATRNSLKQRGPDDHGIKTFTSKHSCPIPYTISLGHTRLSIIDLSSGGHQPMTSFDGRYSIVFNGEIYNYKEIRIELESEGYNFKTGSDTEVLLTAWLHWKFDSLVRLEGMYAFAVHDKVEHTLTFIRDAFGIKPLYYFFDGDEFVFASEVQALQKHLGPKGTINKNTIQSILNFDQTYHK